MKRIRNVLLFTAAAAALLAPAPALAADYHHVQLTTSNATEAVGWYTRYLDCEPVADRDDAVLCGGAELVFDSRPTLGSSQRTGIDHISFSYPDLTVKMGELEAVGVRGSGVRLQRFEDGSTLRDVPGLYQHGYIFDPWGTRIELVEDADTLGFHHIHLSATDPAATLAWYLERFGGESARLRDQMDGVRMGDIWLFAMEAEAPPAPTAGRSIDHIAFAVPEMDAAAAELRGDGVAFLSEPAVPEGGRTAARQAFIGGPDNVRLALVEEGFAGVDAEFDAPVDITTELREYTVPRTPVGRAGLPGRLDRRRGPRHSPPAARRPRRDRGADGRAGGGAARARHPRQHLGLRVRVGATPPSATCGRRPRGRWRWSSIRPTAACPRAPPRASVSSRRRGPPAGRSPRAPRTSARGCGASPAASSRPRASTTTGSRSCRGRTTSRCSAR